LSNADLKQRIATAAPARTGRAPRYPRREYQEFGDYFATFVLFLRLRRVSGTTIVDAGADKKGSGNCIPSGVSQR
jgi:hypothetical protein